MRTLIIGALAFLACHGAHAQIKEADAEIAADRLRILMDIGQSVRASAAPLVQSAQATVQAQNTTERAALAAQFDARAEDFLLAINDAHAQLGALGDIPDTPSDPSLATVVREQQRLADMRLSALAEIISRLESLVDAVIANNQILAQQEAGALIEGSALLTRAVADQNRMQALLTPQYPWANPMDNAAAELIDGMASLMEVAASTATIPPESLAVLESGANRIRELVLKAEQEMSDIDDAEIEELLELLRPRLKERQMMLRQAADQMEVAAQVTTASQVQEQLLALQAIYRAFVASQQSPLQ